MCSKSTNSTVLLLIFLTGLTFLAGCGSMGDGHNVGNQPNPPANKIRVELRPPESGERLRRHVYTPDGVTELEVQIEYADGRLSYRYLRPNGTCREEKVTFPGVTSLRSHALYGEDGIEVLSAEIFRLDGTKEAEFAQLGGGSKKTTFYYQDGKTVYCLVIAQASGAKEKTFYRKDGITIWAKESISQAGLSVAEYFGPDGKIQQRRQERADRGFDITVFRSDGTAEYVQSWWTNDQLRYFQMYLLESVTEYQADGKTPLRQLFMSKNGRDLVKAIKFNADGTKESIWYFRADGTLEKKELLDKSGQVKATEAHLAAEGIRENVDISHLGEPVLKDPPPNLRSLERMR